MTFKTRGFLQTLGVITITASIVLVWGVALAGLITGTMSCGGGPNKQHTLRAARIATNAARDHYMKWDPERQLEIVKECPDRACYTMRVTEHRAKREAMTRAFAAVYNAIADALTDDSDAATKAALAASGKVIEVVKDLKPADSHPAPPNIADSAWTCGTCGTIDAGVPSDAGISDAGAQ